MGACCNKRKDQDSLMSIAPLDERDLTPQKFSSSYDDIYKVIEIKNNFLTYITLVEYINLLEKYTIESATNPFEGNMKTNFSSKDEFLVSIVSEEEFHSFIDNKLFEIPHIKKMFGNNEKMAITTKNILLELYMALKLKLGAHYNKEANSEFITKRTLIPFGILFCASNIVGKVKLIFDIFKNEEEEKFYKSDSFDEFLISSFLISSFGMLHTRNKISQTNNSISELSQNQIQEMLKGCELYKNQHLLKEFNETFFDKESFTWIEFKEKFENKDKGFQWILSPKGIRQKLEEIVINNE